MLLLVCSRLDSAGAVIHAMALLKAIVLVVVNGVVGQDCSGEGVTWGPGIGPPPDGCGGPGSSPPPSTTAAGGSADCSGEGVTWGPGIGPPPAGCGGTGPSPPPSGNTGGSCQNPSCANPPCAAPLLGDVGCTTVAGNEIYAHEQLAAGDTISSGAHIFGPFEAGFSSQQDNIIATWGCSTPSVTWIQSEM